MFAQNAYDTKFTENFTGKERDEEIYNDLLGVNNAIREGTLPKNQEAFGKEYDPIYGRDYDAFMQLDLK